MFRVLGCLANLFALIFAILFILSAPIALLLLNIQWQLLQSGIYKRALAEQNVYGRLPAMVAETLTGSFVFNPCEANPDDERCKQEGPADPREQMLYPVFTTTSPQLRTCLRQVLGAEAFAALSAGKRVATAGESLKIKPCIKQYGLPAQVRNPGGGAPLYLFMLERSDWEAILTALLPADWFQAQTESVLDQLFAYLDFKTDSVRVSLIELKERLHGDAGTVLITRILRAQPPCTPEQLARLARAGANIGDIQLCRPPDAVLDLTMSRLGSIAGQVWDQLPDEVVLIQENEPADVSPKGGRGGFFAAETPREVISRVRLVLNVGALVVPLVLLGLMTLFGARSLAGLLRWWGVALTIVGALCGGAALAGWLEMDSLAAMALGRGRSLVGGLPPDMVLMLMEVGKQIAREFASWVGIESAATLILGLVLYCGSFIFRPSNRRRL